MPGAVKRRARCTGGARLLLKGPPMSIRLLALAFCVAAAAPAYAGSASRSGAVAASRLSPVPRQVALLKTSAYQGKDAQVRGSSLGKRVAPTVKVARGTKP